MQQYKSDGLLTVILHYGSEAMSRRLYAQLKSCEPNINLRVFDNNAPEIFKGAHFRSDSNLFWAGALKKCLEMAESEGFSHLWFLNNDISFETKPPVATRAFVRLKKLEEKLGPIGIYSPSLTKNPYHPQMEQNASAAYRLVRIMDGIAPLINLSCARECFPDIKGNERGYGVDIAFSYEAGKSGWKLLLDHGLSIRHRYHSTASETEGFLQQAAIDEKNYLTRKFGTHYQQKIKTLQTDFHDEILF